LKSSSQSSQITQKSPSEQPPRIGSPLQLDKPTHYSYCPLIQSIHLALGFIFVALATVGLFLPVLPTTPLLILAAACFAKSSKKRHQWLLNNPTFGPAIRNWEEHRCMNLKSKIIALSAMGLFGGYSTLFILNNLYLQIASGLLVTAGMIFVGRIKICRK